MTKLTIGIRPWQAAVGTKSDLYFSCKLIGWVHLVQAVDLSQKMATGRPTALNLAFEIYLYPLVTRKPYGGAMRRTNPDSLKSCLCFQVFRLNFASDFFNSLLAGFHQAEIIIVKHLIQGRNNEARLGVEILTLRSWSS